MRNATTDTAFMLFLTSNRDGALATRNRGEEVPRGPHSPNQTPEAWQYAIEVVRHWAHSDKPIEDRAYIRDSMPYGIMVHVSHCCLTHGCKYGPDKPCAVARGYFKQDHPCEQCDEDMAEAAEGVEIIKQRLRERLGRRNLENVPLHERVRAIADLDNEFTPVLLLGPELLREIASELETMQKIREAMNG